jgi:hypothetical protein
VVEGEPWVLRQATAVEVGEGKTKAKTIVNFPTWAAEGAQKTVMQVLVVDNMVEEAVVEEATTSSRASVLHLNLPVVPHPHNNIIMISICMVVVVVVVVVRPCRTNSVETCLWVV